MSNTYYTEDHEWLVVDEDTATLGITNYAQDNLGDLVFIELPHVQTTISKGDVIAVVESAKTASDIYAPVTGTITAVNSVLETAPETINQDAEQSGWICKITMDDKTQLETLLSKEQYTKLIQ